MEHNFDAYKTAQRIVDKFDDAEDENGEPLGDYIVLEMCLTHIELLSEMDGVLDLPSITIQSISEHVKSILKRPFLK